MAAHNRVSAVRRLCCLLAGCLGLACVAARASDASIAVQLKDGRTIRGEIDVRTSDRRLWLHSAEPGIILHSSFEWDDVVSGEHAGRVLSADELRPLAAQLKTDVDPELVRGTALVGPAAADPTRAVAHRLCAQHARIASLHVDASAANWDDDPEDDGLLVYVYPLTADGRLLPVDGQLSLKLFGRITEPSEPSLRGTYFPELTRGSLRVRAADFGPDGAVYKFPFRNFHPERDLDLDVLGLLSARLVVAGQGAFDASDDNVRLRRLSRFRDQLQLQRGSRFLPAENFRRRPL